MVVEKLFRKNNFRLEALLALLLFGLPFAFPLHTLFSETTNVISVFGYEFDHDYVDNQYFVWSLTIKYVSICYLVFWLLFHKRLDRVYVFFPLFIFIYILLKSPSQFNFLNIEYVVIGISVLFVLVGYMRFRTTRIRLLKNKNYLDAIFGFLIITSSLGYMLSFLKLMQKPSIDFVLFKISAVGFNDVGVLLWYLSIKFLLIMPLLYWFITETKWWKYALLSPILIFSMQLYNTFTTGDAGVDEIEVFQTLHFTIPLLIILLILARAVEKQEIIGDWLKIKYKGLESNINKRFYQKQQIIQNGKEVISKKNIDINKLIELKSLLESEIAEKS